MTSDYLCNPNAALLFYFFFQAEDGIRDKLVTGVQTCALPISRAYPSFAPRREDLADAARHVSHVSARKVVSTGQVERTLGDALGEGLFGLAARPHGVLAEDRKSVV